MPAPQTNFIATTDKAGYDPATLSDDEDDQSQSSRSTWASTSSTTILGFADGFLPQDEQAEGAGQDWRVSRIGGLPSFPLAQAPDQASSTSCRACHNQMPLLTQIYCPLESSSLERVVYVFACPRTACRKKEGSIRAFRANRLWKDSPEEKARIENEKRENQPKAVAVDLGGLVFGGGSTGPTKTTSSNPFATSSSPSSNPFATASPFSPISTTTTTNPFAPSPSSSLNPFAPSTATAASSSSVTTEAPAERPETTLPSGEVSSTWASGPSYPPQYITTSYEPSSPKISSKSLPPMASLSLSDPSSSIPGGDDDRDDEYDSHRKEGKGAGGRTKKGSGGGKGRPDGSGSRTGTGGGAGGGPAAGEGYEVQRVKGVDQVFLKFQERVSREGAQIVRYEHDTQPLAFSASSPAYKTLYPPSSSSDELGTFNPGRLPACRTCHQRSVFEYQLMPNLISILNRSEGSRGTSAYGEKQRGTNEEGLDWATVWVFTCGAECVPVGQGNQDKEGWNEERVLVEWEE